MNKSGFTCDSASILQQCRREMRTQGPAAYGLCMGLDMIRGGLAEFAKRAIELEDEKMLGVCEQLCLIKEVEVTDHDGRASK